MFLSWPPDSQHAIVGILVSGLVAALTGDLFVRRPSHFTHIHRYFWFGYYVILFSWECLKSNIDVAYRVIHPKLPINPGIVKVKTSLRSDAALTFLANSITLTPGTFCVDIKPEEGTIYIHWLDVKSQDIEQASRLIVDKFENVLERIFE